MGLSQKLADIFFGTYLTSINLNNRLALSDRTDQMINILVETANHDDYQGGAKYHETDAALRPHGFKLQNIFANFSCDLLY